MNDKPAMANTQAFAVITQDELSSLRAELAELRALVSEPVAWMHNKRVDVIHTSVKSLLSDFAVNYGPESMLRPIDKSEHYTIPLYAAPVPLAEFDANIAKAKAALRELRHDVKKAKAVKAEYEKH